PRVGRTKNVHVPVVLQSQLAWQMLEHFELRTSFSKAAKIAIKHKGSTHLPGQRSLQISDPTPSIHRLHVTPCGSPNEFRLSRRQLHHVLVRPRNVCAAHNSPVPTDVAPRLRLIRLRRVATHISD